MALQPMPLSRRALPFDHPEWIFELKYDGFRAVAVIADGRCQLVSRNGNVFKSFDILASKLPKEIRADSALIDGEIVCLDSRGRSQFSDLFYRRKEPIFVAFDLLSADGQDFRPLPLIDRKLELGRRLHSQLTHVLYCQHLELNGRGLFALACKHDLEGIVAKWKFGKYLSGRDETTWFKIRNGSYSQRGGRDKIFNRPQEPVLGAGWDACTVAATASAESPWAILA